MPEEWTLRDASEKKRKADENHGCGPGRPRRAEENNNQRGGLANEKACVVCVKAIGGRGTVPVKTRVVWLTNVGQGVKGPLPSELPCREVTW